MNKQLNFRIPKMSEIQLELLCEKFGVDKTTIILWSINQMAVDNDITKELIYEKAKQCE